MLVLNCPGAKLSDAKLSIFFSCCQIVCFYYLVAKLSGGQLFWYEVEQCEIVLPPHGMVGQFFAPSASKYQWIKEVGMFVKCE